MRDSGGHGGRLGVEAKLGTEEEELPCLNPSGKSIEWDRTPIVPNPRIPNEP